jgi:hypothetical protein
MQYFGQTAQDLFNYEELTHLFTLKSSRKTQNLDYRDFSRWFGGIIQQSEGFYFRHDSKANPEMQEIAKKTQRRLVINPKSAIVNTD